MGKTIGLKQPWMIGIVVVVGLLLSFSTVCAYTLAVARVEYRDYNNPASSHTRVPLMFTDASGNYVDPNISSVTIVYMGAEIEQVSSSGGWYSQLEGEYDESTGQWKFNDTLSAGYYSRVTIAPSNEFADAVAPSGTYSLTVETDDGTYTADLSFNGKQVLPRIDSNSFEFSYNKSGDLTISWMLPDQSQFPAGASLSLYIEDADDYTNAGSFSMPPGVNRITIPQKNLSLLGSPDAFYVTMRTQSQDRTNRAYSDTATVQTASIPVNTQIDGGYDIGSSLWLKAILQVTGSPVTLIWKEVGTDTTPSGDKVVSGYFYADPNDFAFGSVYNPELFVKIYIAGNGWCNIAFNHVTVDDVTVDSAHQYSGAADMTGSVTLTSRLAEHQYNGVSLQ